jgi:hypothetical protein
MQILRLLGGNFRIAIATCFLPRVNGTYFESGRAICTAHFLGSHLGSGLVMRMARLPSISSGRGLLCHGAPC